MSPPHIHFYWVELPKIRSYTHIPTAAASARECVHRKLELKSKSTIFSRLFVPPERGDSEAKESSEGGCLPLRAFSAIDSHYYLTGCCQEGLGGGGCGGELVHCGMNRGGPSFPSFSFPERLSGRVSRVTDRRGREGERSNIFPKTREESVSSTFNRSITLML